MNSEKFEKLFPKTSRNTRNRYSLRHERRISKGVAHHIRQFLTDEEAETMTFKQLVLTAKERSGFSSEMYKCTGFDTYFYCDALLEPQIETATYEESRVRAEAGDAYEALMAYKAEVVK